MRKLLNNTRGISILEVLIAALITGILTAGVFSFYVRTSAQSEAQFNLTDAQHLCRVSADDIKKNLRMAGYKIPAGHPPYEINGDSLSIYFSETQPVDTVMYYLSEFTSSEYSVLANRDQSVAVYKLMKKVNSQAPQIYADYILSLSFTNPSSSVVVVNITSQTTEEDLSRSDAFSQVDGEQSTVGKYDTYAVEERITMRNVNL